MSKYLRIVMEEMTSQDILAAALKAAEDRFGVTVEAAEGNSLPMYGYHGDLRPERAAFVIRRWDIGSASNDLGWAWNGAAFEAVISEFDRGTKAAEMVEWVANRYAAGQFIADAEAQGYVVSGAIEEGADGTLEFELVQVYGG